MKMKTNKKLEPYGFSFFQFLVCVFGTAKARKMEVYEDPLPQQSLSVINRAIAAGKKRLRTIKTRRGVVTVIKHPLLDGKK